MVGEEIGIKSLWHVEIEESSGKKNIDGELIAFGELKATLIFDNCIGIGNGFVKRTPFSANARLSIIHPQTSDVIHKFASRVRSTIDWNIITVIPELQVINVQANGEKAGAEFKISHREILDALVGNTVCIISVDLEIFGNDYSFEMISNLQRDFVKLLMDQDSFDFTIECDGKIFKVHKSILGARSTVFAAMLSNKDFKECQSNSLVVEDIDQPTMEILLHYIYTGKPLTELMKNSSVLESVIRGADKYGLSDLKNHCFHKLVQSVTVENFGAMVVLGFAVNAETKEKVILKDYYLRNVLSLIKKESKVGCPAPRGHL